MAEFINFMNFNDFNNFKELKNELISPPNNFRIQETNDLFLCRYKNKNIYDNGNTIFTDMNHPIANCSRGIIIDKTTHRIVCYPLDKSMSITKFYKLPFNEFNFEDSIDGTQVNLFYYKNKWCLSTIGCIDAFDCYWKSSNSFGELFSRLFLELSDISYLNIKYCYSFILCHPENNNIIQYSKPKLYHIMTRNMMNFVKIDVDIQIPKPKKRFFESEIDLWNYLDTASIDNKTGVVAHHPEHGHYRFNCTKFNTLLRLIKNEKDDDLVILNNINNINNIEILSSYINKFNNVYKNISIWIDIVCSEIFNYYYLVKIKRKWVELPYYVKPLIYELHDIYIHKIRNWDYTRTLLNKELKKPIMTEEAVLSWFYKLPPRRMRFIINQCKLKTKLD